MLRTRLIAGQTTALVSGAVFASVMTLVAASETLVEPLRVIPPAPAPVTLRLPASALALAGQTDVQHLRPVTIRRGQVVGDPITSAAIRIYEGHRRPPSLGFLGGLWFLYFLIVQMLLTYLRRFSQGRGALLRTQTGLLALLAVVLVVTKAYVLLAPLSPLAVPIAAVPMWVALYTDRRAAIVVALTLAFLAASLVDFSPVAVMVFLASGLTATVAFRDLKHPIRMLHAGAIAGVVAAATLVPTQMLFEGHGIVWPSGLGDALRSDLVGAALGGVMGGVVGFALHGFAVLTLGAVSRRRLMDLADLDNRLLRKMAAEAPGSWEHSRMMANLAEGAASAIGADALLTRVGAYYHDLGKTVQSKFFVENLEPGEVSPHEGLAPDVSADAIMVHVVEGTRILREGGIPEPVVEFAYTHHGTSVIEYFWHRCLEQGNPRKLKESFFRYPGMRPRSKETAILMLVDSIEAAARTVSPPSREKFQELVQRIVFVKLQQGQLDESGLTMFQLRTVTIQIVDSLCSAYHSRIKYPWQDREERGESPLPIPDAATEQDVARELNQNMAANRSARLSEPAPSPSVPAAAVPTASAPPAAAAADTTAENEGQER